MSQTHLIDGQGDTLLAWLLVASIAIELSYIHKDAG